MILFEEEQVIPAS